MTQTLRLLARGRSICGGVDDVTYQTTATATPPDATVIKTDEIDGKHYQRVKLTDGAADSETHAKVGTAQAGLSDPGLVTRPASVAPDVTASGTIDDVDETVTIAIQGRQSVGARIDASGYIGTVTAEVSTDGGSTYSDTWMTKIDAIRETLISWDFAEDNVFQFAIALQSGATHVRIRVTAFTSGTLPVELRASSSPESLPAWVHRNAPASDYLGVGLSLPVSGSFDRSAPIVTTTTPDASEFGLITRNIPSGTQTVEPAVAAGVALSNVNDTNSSTTLLSANADRRGVAIFNDSTEALYVKFGATASTTSFTVKILAGGFYEMPTPIYVGIIDGIWAANASGAARITELT